MIVAEQTIWFPGLPDVTYRGREDEDYTQLAAEAPFEMLVLLAQERAKEDGEWLIAHDLVGDNEEKMRKMMEFVSDRRNIGQCLEHIFAEGKDNERTVDWLCRDLANASKVMVR